MGDKGDETAVASGPLDVVAPTHEAAGDRAVESGRAGVGHEILFEDEWKEFEGSILKSPAPKAAQETRGALETEAPAESPAPPPPMTASVADEAAEVPSSGAAHETGARDVRDGASESGPSRLSRAAAVTEGLRPRVERVREVSIVVLEEASEDSGLRFVLIAVALFLLFLLFLFLHTFLK
jgi:cobalamin biosynthesis Mg chelatase CobN